MMSFVEIGVDGWLFLQNDVNDTPAVVAGKHALSTSEVFSIVETLKRRCNYFKSIGAKGMTYVVPDKSVICYEKRIGCPPPSPSRPAAQLAAATSALPRPIYAYGQADFNRVDIKLNGFTATDTHISSFGQLVVFESILSRLGLENDLQWHPAGIESFTGDLGAKFNPPKVENIFRYHPFVNTSQLIDEVSEIAESGRGKLRGRRIWHENRNAKGGICVLVGTSTAYYMRELFCNV